jgi:hypothetical protein
VESSESRLGAQHKIEIEDDASEPSEEPVESIKIDDSKPLVEEPVEIIEIEDSEPEETVDVVEIEDSDPEDQVEIIEIEDSEPSGEPAKPVRKKKGAADQEDTAERSRLPKWKLKVN